MAFRPLNFEEGKVIFAPGTNAETFTKGDALIYSSGLLTAAASGTTTDIEFVVAKTVTTVSSGELIEVYPATPDILYEADTDAAWSTVDQGTFADLATVSTINPDASSNDLFKIVRGVGVAETDTVVIGYFTRDVTAS